MESIKDLSKITNNGANYIDVYVSTDVSEVGSILDNAGFRETYEEIRQHSIKDRFLHTAWRNNGTLIEGAEIEGEEILRIERELGFNCMSIVRIHGNGPRLENLCGAFIKLLKAEEQNMGFVDSSHSLVYRAVSNNYRLPQRLLAAAN